MHVHRWEVRSVAASSQAAAAAAPGEVRAEIGISRDALDAAARSLSQLTEQLHMQRTLVHDRPEIRCVYQSYDPCHAAGMLLQCWTYYVMHAHMFACDSVHGIRKRQGSVAHLNTASSGSMLELAAWPLFAERTSLHISVMHACCTQAPCAAGMHLAAAPPTPA